MGDLAVAIESYEEIAADLAEPHASAVQHALDSGCMALVLPNWIAEQTDLEPTGRSHRVYAGTVARETEDGVKFRSSDGEESIEAWTSKTESTVYALANESDAVRGGPTSLTDFSTGGSPTEVSD